MSYRPNCPAWAGRADTATAATATQMAIMRACGIHVVASPAEIGDAMLKALGSK